MIFWICEEWWWCFMHKILHFCPKYKGDVIILEVIFNSVRIQKCDVIIVEVILNNLFTSHNGYLLTFLVISLMPLIGWLDEAGWLGVGSFTTSVLCEKVTNELARCKTGVCLQTLHCIATILIISYHCACANPLLTRLQPGLSNYMRPSQLAKRADPFGENEPARQVSQPVFNPPPYNRNFLLLLNFCNSRVVFKNRFPFKRASTEPTRLI